MNKEEKLLEKASSKMSFGGAIITVAMKDSLITLIKELRSETAKAIFEDLEKTNFQLINSVCIHVDRYNELKKKWCK